MFEFILVPLDGSDAAEYALSYAKRMGSKIRLVRVALPVRSGPMDLSAEQQTLQLDKQACEDYLERLAGGLCQEGFLVSKSVRISDSAASGILHEASQEPFDLIVMASQRRTGFSRWVQGSVCEKVTRHAQCPVMSIRYLAAKTSDESLDEQLAVPVAGQ